MDFREMFNRHFENMHYSRVYTKPDKVATKTHGKEGNK